MVDKSEKETADGTSGGSTDGGSGDGHRYKVYPVSSPFHQHSSDSPNQMFVEEVLTDVNYGEWVVDITEILIAQNKLGFVNGMVTRPNEGDDLDAWIRCNALVKGWLKTTMSKEIRTSVRYARTAREIWLDLQQRFSHGSAPRAYELRRAIGFLRQEKLSILGFYTKLRSLWGEMSSVSPDPRCECGKCTCNLEVRMQEKQEKNQLFDFLLGLDEAYSTVRSKVLSTNPIPSLSEANRTVSWRSNNASSPPADQAKLRPPHSLERGSVT
ncbi:unnamed protein product [Linum trigynum]|uniref:Retrotransposon Copia-like N-terminal domain-containing protein n=1 Tax=Linum trigynum TaxID=586398 RepID=A0AAV2DUF9_9ROSI